MSLKNSIYFTPLMSTLCWINWTAHIIWWKNFKIELVYKPKKIRKNFLCNWPKCIYLKLVWMVKANFWYFVSTNFVEFPTSMSYSTFIRKIRVNCFPQLSSFRFLIHCISIETNSVDRWESIDQSGCRFVKAISYRGWCKSNATNFLLVFCCYKFLFNKKLDCAQNFSDSCDEV